MGIDVADADAELAQAAQLSAALGDYVVAGDPPQQRAGDELRETVELAGVWIAQTRHIVGRSDGLAVRQIEMQTHMEGWRGAQARDSVREAGSVGK